MGEGSHGLPSGAFRASLSRGGRLQNPSSTRAPKQMQWTSQAACTRKASQEGAGGKRPREGCLAPGTEAEPLFPSLFPFSSSGISCTMSSAALLPPTAPWGTGGRTWGLALIWGVGERLADLGDEDTRATQEKIQPRLRTGDLEVFHPPRPPPGTGSQPPELSVVRPHRGTWNWGLGGSAQALQMAFSSLAAPSSPPPHNLVREKQYPGHHAASQESPRRSCSIRAGPA